MKAIVTTQYGSPDVLQLQEVEKPTPSASEVLIKVHATSLNSADWRLMRADPVFIRFAEGLRKPKQPIGGSDVAGTIEAIGKDVTQFNIGDEVYADLSSDGRAGLAEYVVASAHIVAMKPKTASFEEASAVPMAAGTALQGLRNEGKIKAGQKILIHGASGGVGSFAVQIAKAFGAEVTAVCSTGKVEMVRELGADHVIDYKQEDFAQRPERYDLIFAPNGDRSIFDYKRALANDGLYVCGGGSMKQIFQAMLLGPFLSRGGISINGGFVARPDAEDLDTLAELIDTGKIRPEIDGCYPLEETAEAMRYLEKGAKGKVVIRMMNA